MKMRLAWALVGMVAAGSAFAAEEPRPEACEVPDHLREFAAELPRLRAARSGGQPLRIVVVGTASSSGAGVSSPAEAYPARLEQELVRRLPGATVSVAVRAKTGETAAQAVKRFKPDVLSLRPALVLWQTGTVDAFRDADEEAFARAQIAGIDALRAGGSDVVLIDMQYNPYTSTMVHLGRFRMQMTWVSQLREVSLFRRYEIMQYWYDNGIFDLSTSDKAEQQRNARLIHACLGRILADAIVGATAEAGNTAR
jgi:hypothetical protein